MKGRFSWQIHVESKFFVFIFSEFWNVKIAGEVGLQDGCICRFWMDVLIFPTVCQIRIKVIYLLSTLYLPYLYQLVQLMQIKHLRMHIEEVATVKGSYSHCWVSIRS